MPSTVMSCALIANKTRKTVSHRARHGPGTARKRERIRTISENPGRVRNFLSCPNRAARLDVTLFLSRTDDRFAFIRKSG